MNIRSQNLQQGFFSFIDLFALNFINLIFLPHIEKYTYSFYLYTISFLFSNVAWMICSYSSTIYFNAKHTTLSRLIYATLAAFVFYNCLLIIFLSTVLNQMFNLYVFFGQCGFALFLLISRLLYVVVVGETFLTKNSLKKIAFIGCNQHVKTLINYFSKNRKSTVIAGFFDDDGEIQLGLPFLGSIKGCIEYSQENNITEIYSTLSPKLYPLLTKLAEAAEKKFIRFRFVPDLSEFAGNNCKVDFIDNTAIISFRDEPLADITEQVKKRFFDIVFSCLILIFILSWLIPLLGIFIKINSKGPVFFTQLRSGKNNIPFRVIKLRTLAVNDYADSLQVTRNDGRITKLGRFLRKTNLDELPQFFNVLAGNMSIVGSRPHMLKHTKEYSQQYDNYMLRHYTKPGITGWAQVNGFRGEIKEPEQLKQRVEHDIWYTENWSIWLDFKIVGLTVYKTICGDENAF